MTTKRMMVLPKIDHIRNEMLDRVEYEVTEHVLTLQLYSGIQRQGPYGRKDFKECIFQL